MSASVLSSHPSTSDSTAKCPVTGRTHEWRAPEEHASRSPCPALNTMANHDYLPRDGRNITLPMLIAGLQECYNLSAPLAYFLSIGGFLLLRNFFFRPFNLYDIGRHEDGRHSRVEHNASLVHRDTEPGDLYAPITIVDELVDELIKDAKTDRDKGRVLMSAQDVARSRVRAEKKSAPLTAVQAEIARGEMAIMLGMWGVTEGDNEGALADWVAEWIGKERLPEAWTNKRSQGLLATVKKAKEIKLAMDSIRAEEQKNGAITGGAAVVGKAASTSVRALGLDGLSRRSTVASDTSMSSSDSSVLADTSVESSETSATSDSEEERKEL